MPSLSRSYNLSNHQSSAERITIAFLLFDVIPAPEFFFQLRDEAVLSTQLVMCVSEKANASCAAILSAIEVNLSFRPVPLKIITFLTSTNSSLVELGTEHIHKVNTLGHEMWKFVKKDQCLDLLFRAMLGTDMNGLVFFKGGVDIQLTFHGMRTAFVHSFHMAVPKPFEVVLSLTALVHTDSTIKDRNLNIHRTYKAGSHITVTVSLLWAMWKQ